MRSDRYAWVLGHCLGIHGRSKSLAVRCSAPTGHASPLADRDSLLPDRCFLLLDRVSRLVGRFPRVADRLTRLSGPDFGLAPRDNSVTELKSRLTARDLQLAARPLWLAALPSRLAACCSWFAARGFRSTDGDSRLVWCSTLLLVYVSGASILMNARVADSTRHFGIHRNRPPRDIYQ